MATETYGYTAPQYFYWGLSSNGGKYIRNYSTNYLMKKNSGGWEHVRDANGNYLTVSGDGANLTGTSKADDIYNEGANANINAGAGEDYIRNQYGENVTVDSGNGKDFINNHVGSGLFFGGKGDDTLFTCGNNVKIYGGADNDSISNGGYDGYNWQGAGENVTMDGGEGDDTIRNDYGDKVTIDGGIGNDSIESWGSNISINGGADSDSIWSGEGENITLDGGAGDDLVDNEAGRNVLIFGGEGNDTLISGNSGTRYITISGGAGNDSIRNRDGNVSISAGDDNDTISNSGDNVTIDAGDDEDRINNSGSYVKINAGDGNDHVGNTGSEVTINAGTGNDSIFNSAASVKINTTGDNVGDFIYNDSSEVTITAGAGADSIIVKWASGSKINGGDGDNGVSLFGGGNISVTTGAGNDSIVLYGKYAGKEIYDIYIDDNDYYCTNVTINPGGGKNFVSIPGSIDNVKVVGDEKSEGVDVIFNDAYGAVIDGGAGNDYIRNTGEGAFIFGGYDGDVIQNYASHVCIYGDNAKGKSLHKVGDYIYTDKGEDVKINGGNSDDTIVALHDVNASISGGDGNDEIEVQRMSAEDVNKIIVNGVISPLLAITSFITKVPIPTQFDEAVLSAGQVAEEVLFDGKTLSKINNAVTVGRQIINLVQLQGYVENLVDTTSTINGGKGNDTIINDGTASRVFEYASGDGDDVITNFVADSKVQAVLIDKPVSTLHITKGTADEVTVDGKDVIFKVDTGSIKLVNTATKRFQVRDKKGTLTARTYDTDKSNNVYLTEYISGAKEMYFGNGGDDTIHGTEKAESIFGGDGNDDIYGFTLRDPIAGGKDYLDGGAGDDYLRAIKGHNTLIGGADNDYVYNGGWFASINGGDGKDTLESRGDYTTIRGGKGNDLINDRFSPKSLFDGGAGNDTINVFGQKVTVTGSTDNDQIFLNSTGNLIKYAAGDGFDTIYGFNSTDSLSISGGSYSTTASGSDVLVTVGKGKITLKDVKGNAVYINKKNVGGSSTDKKFIALTSGDDTINNDLDGVTISGGTGNDVIENDFGDKVSINAGAGNDTIWNIAREEWNSATNSVDTLDTPDKATLVGGTGNDYIYNQVGKNVRFQYTSGDGNDTITGFNETSTLAIVGSKYSTTKSSDDVIVTVDKGKITLDGAANLGSVNIDFSKRLTVTDKTSSPVTVASDVDIIDASSRTKAAKITGNSKANMISGGAGKDTIYGAGGNDSIVGNAGNDKLYGDAGKDTLVGGKGNDSLWGGAGNDALYGGDGKDTFIYKPGEGTDTIFDYEAGDMLTILKSNGKAGGSFTSSKFSGGDLTLSINGGGKVIFDNVSANDSFNINGKSYSISGTKLK